MIVTNKLGRTQGTSTPLLTATHDSNWLLRRQELSARYSHLGVTADLVALSNGRDTLPTNQVAAIINRRPQTLRKWACLENGPIRPVRINGRLAWRVVDLAMLLNGGHQ